MEKEIKVLDSFEILDVEIMNSLHHKSFDLSWMNFLGKTNFEYLSTSPKFKFSKVEIREDIHSYIKSEEFNLIKEKYLSEWLREESDEEFINIFEDAREINFYSLVEGYVTSFHILEKFTNFEEMKFKVQEVLH